MVQPVQVPRVGIGTDVHAFAPAGSDRPLRLAGLDWPGELGLVGTSLTGYDCVLIATHHAAYDWQQVADNAKLIVDTRNAMRNVTGRRDHIVQA